MAEQVGKFLTELPELETPTDDDAMYIVDGSIASKKITMANLKRVLGGNVTGTVEDASVSFSDGADGIPMEECEVTLVPAQDLHGYSKPWAGGANYNKWDEEWEVGYIDSQGNNTPSTVNIRSKNHTPIEPNTSYYLKSGYTTVVYCPIFFYDANKVFLSANLQQIWNTVITTPPNARYIRFYMNSAYGDVYNNDIGINYPSTETDYSPYANICPISGHTEVTVTVASTSGGSGEDNTVSLGRTVYGGTLDVTTGELTVTHGFKTYTGDASENWIYTSSLNRVYINIADAIRPSDYAEIQSNILHYSLPQENYGSYINNQGNLIVYAPTTITSASDWKTWLSSNNLQIVYELATPQTYQLTPAQVTTLLGQNYVSHNGGGNIKVVYIRDLDITINDLIDRVTALENE